MALYNVLGGLGLDETLKSLIEKFRDKKEPLFVTNGEDPLIVEAHIRPDPLIGATIYKITSLNTVQVLAPQNNSRTGLTIHNNATSALLYVLCASVSVAASTLYTIPLLAQDYWELPQGASGCYTGPITGIWSAADGNAMITEFSA